VDFFARQEQSRRTSRLLVGMFLLSFLVVALATTVAVAIGLRLYTQNSQLFLGAESWQTWVAANLGLLALVALGTLGAMCLASLSRAASLAGGGGQVARGLGATLVAGDCSDAAQRRLLNVVEEMALASGVPVPEVYVLEQEPAINAFAAGTTHTNAAITVTRGALERLDRSELQGVIAHEFSHILNGDMRLNQQLIGMSFGILVLALAGRWMLRTAQFTRRGRNNGVAAIVALGLALVVIGGIGVLLSRLIKAAVSRQRESLADASGVQFTRDPAGLAGALKKIAVFTGELKSVETEEVAHMMFERAAPSFVGLFATHPPLLERIKALDPSFDPRDLPEPDEPMPDAAAAGSAQAAAFTSAFAPAGAPAPYSAFAPGGTATHAGSLGAAAGAAAADEAVLGRVGQIESPDVGGALRAALPEEVDHAAHSRDSSLLLVLALALSPTDSTRDRQVGLIENQLGSARAAQCRRLFEDLRPLDRGLKLPVLELALPALRQRPVEQLTYLFDLVSRIGGLDNQQPLFDYVLLRVLEAFLRHLPGAPTLVGGSAGGPSGPIRDAVTALLANVAAFGHDNAAAARDAFAAGMAAVGAAATGGPSFEPVTAVRDLDELDRSLRRLSSLRPRDKLKILSAVLATIRRDGKVEVDEQELFRAIAATLDCPLPPIRIAPQSASGSGAQIR
jgi:Zn-dependent protease with chaperone function